MSAWSALVVLTLALLLGAVAAGIRARLGQVLAVDTFRCKARSADMPCVPPPRWPRRGTRAWWVHDVLLIQQGFLRSRAVALGVAGPDGAIRPTCRPEITGLGSDPVVLTLRLDDGRAVDVATRGTDLAALAGPFVVTVLSMLPPAPTEPRMYGR
jgi:hypothetical protein